jgi:hypothetical protein
MSSKRASPRAVLAAAGAQMSCFRNENQREPTLSELAPASPAPRPFRSLGALVLAILLQVCARNPELALAARRRGLCL